jgi:hypothetical protein
MRDLTGCFEQQQALLGGTDRNPPSARSGYDIGVIDMRFETEQRECKSILTGPPFGVASTRIAPRLGENGNNLVAKLDRPETNGR